MVREYKRRSDRGSWSEESMREAVKAVLDAKMGYYKAARQFSVPQTTLERKVKAARLVLNEASDENIPIPIKVPLGPKSPVFSVPEEEELCAYLLEMEERLCGLTTKELQALAYQLALKNNKPNPFNTEKKEAGRDWVKGFLKRHPQISIRKPDNTSASRASGWTLTSNAIVNPNNDRIDNRESASPLLAPNQVEEKPETSLSKQNRSNQHTQLSKSFINQEPVTSQQTLNQQSETLAGHRRNVHFEEMRGFLKTYDCPNCAKQYRYPMGLQNHMNVHHYGRRLVCDVCGKQLANKEKLTLHMRTHTGDKPHKCEFCGKGFAKKTNLTGHVRIHTGEKPYKCEHCPKQFATRSAVTLHMKTHTGERPHSCYVCEKSFASKSALRHHYNTCKGINC